MLNNRFNVAWKICAQGVDLHGAWFGPGRPSTAALTALRARYAGLNSRAAIAQYLQQSKAMGESSRTMLSDIRRQLASYARERHRSELAGLMAQRPSAYSGHARLWTRSRRCGACRRPRLW